MSHTHSTLPSALQAGLTQRRVPTLDGLRALAALAIIFTHMKLLPLWVALNVFFGLSGFLITWLLLQEEGREGRVALKAFYMRRTLRIMPAYYAALAVIVWLFPPNSGPLNAEHIQSVAFYYANYFQAVHGATHGALSPFWSLAAEEQFYLFWPFVFVFARRWRVPLLMGAISLVWWQRWVVCWLEGDLEWAYHAMDCRADHLLVGCLAAIALYRGWVPWLWRLLCERRIMLWVVLSALVGLTLLPLGLGKVYRMGVAFYVEPWLIACLLVQLIALGASGGVSWLEAKPLVWLGQRSYALYLYHVFAMGLVDLAMPQATLWLKALPSVALGVVFAQLSWVLIEAPLHGLRARWRVQTSAS